MGSFLSRLRPTDEEIDRLARRETDPRLYSHFTPLTHGRLFAILALVWIGLVAIACTPFRLLRGKRS